MKVIGLTGGIATGKSTVARMLLDLGAHVVDADAIARAVVEPERPAWREIVEEFGAEILAPDRSVDRKRLGEIVFGDTTRRRRLEEITHPRVAEEMQRRIRQGVEAGAALCVLDVPLLFESKMDAWLRPVVVVWAPPALQLQRILERDHLPREQALRRIASQMPIDEKRRRADFVLENTGSLAELRQRVEDLSEKLREGA